MRRLVVFLTAVCVSTAGWAAVINDKNTDKTEVEGWINSIDVVHSKFVIIDGRGFNHRVRVKQGAVGDFKINDHVKVRDREDHRFAEMIEKIV